MQTNRKMTLTETLLEFFFSQILNCIRMNVKYFLLVLLLFQTCMVHNVSGQNADTGRVRQIVTVQPKIMIIPYTKEGEDLRTLLENDENKRIAVAKIKDSFDSRGFTTVDFVAKLKAAEDNKVFTSDNQTDIKSQLIDISGADVYVQAEVIIGKSSTGNSVKIILTAYEASTGNSLANKVGESGKFYTEDFNKLTSKAVENCVEGFLNVMQAKFTEMLNNGKSVIVNLSFDAGSPNKMSSEIGSGGLPLSDEIESWIGKNAFKNNYHIQGTTDYKMIFDDVKIPLKDQATGTNYNPNKFALELFKFLKGLGLQPKKDVKGNTIYLTFNNLIPDNITEKNTKTGDNNIVAGTSDVDINIPVNAQTSNKTFVVIIANENYQKEVKVQYAANDGKVFREYCEKTLGVPSENIHFAQDASFGNMRSEIKWISDVASAFAGQAKIIFYYAGHGMPNEADKTAYLLPVDGFSSDFETAIRLDDLYNRLAANPSQSITVFLDACFSGSARDDGMLANARGIKIKPKTDLIKGNTIVFSAATGDETAYPYKVKQHGLFTYFLLKKIQETKGNVDYKTLSDYITENVKQHSIVVNQKSQTPQVNTSMQVQEIWQTFRLK